MAQKLVSLSSLLVLLNADCYLHFPRGCNNRLNEKSANRNNGNRLFDSQNNNRGGYNVCDCDPDEGFSATDWMATPQEMYDWRFLYEHDDATSANKLEKQYEEIFFTESWLSTTWTIQHGANNKKLLSQIVLQYGCDTFPRPNPGLTAVSGPTVSTTDTNLQKMRAFGLRMELMNGGNTNTPDKPDSLDDISTTYSSNNQNNRGRHESEEYYRMCETRSRQNGLFHADQKLQGTTQKYTRQNPGGTRRGLECPEERDYYPWWNPSPWHDIAIITHDEDYCRSTIAPNSQNVQSKCGCLNPTWQSGTSDTSLFPALTYAKYNLNQTACEANGGDWECFKWNGAQPECVTGDWSKVNYLGNVDHAESVNGGKQAHYDWKLPSWSSLTTDNFCHSYQYTIQPTSDVDTFTSQGGTSYRVDWGGDEDYSQTINCVRMVFRIRYNISTADYDPYKTTFRQDDKPNSGIISPIDQNPELDVGVLAGGIQLAINTAQTGRTFQDRTHTFLVCRRPDDVSVSNRWGTSGTLINVGVRGKRGNIVQTFPATEYDFEPQHIYVTNNECLHFQWCGSNTHNNGAPGGDGQTGDAGEGQGGTDKHNLVEMRNLDESYPLTYDKFTSGQFFDYVTCYHPLNSATTVSKEDAQLILGSGGFYKSKAYADRVLGIVDSNGNLDPDGTGNGEDAVLNELLNNVSGSFRAGLICCVNSDAVTSAKTELPFSFLCTRNNNFSNRSQKLKIVITGSNEKLMPYAGW